MCILSYTSQGTVVNASPNHHPNTRPLIKLTPQQIYQLTGHRMTLKEKITFSLVKRIMKKSLRSKNRLKALEFITSYNKRDVLGAILVVIVAIVLFVYLLFLIFHKE